MTPPHIVHHLYASKKRRQSEKVKNVDLFPRKAKQFSKQSLFQNCDADQLFVQLTKPMTIDNTFNHFQNCDADQLVLSPLEARA